MTPIVGIDIGKRACHVCIKHHPTSEPIQFTVPHGETATRILELLPGDPPAIIAMERTGNLSNPILAALGTPLIS